MLITQCAIWLLTLCRYRKGRRNGWADVPIVSRVMRDGGLIFIASTGKHLIFVYLSTYEPCFSAMIAVVTPYSLRVRDLSHVISTWVSLNWESVLIWRTITVGLSVLCFLSWYALCLFSNMILCWLADARHADWYSVCKICAKTPRPITNLTTLVSG